jgi:hypothetical protein
VRAYTPDVIAGFIDGFGGNVGGYYDANGHYTRISIQGGTPALAQTLSLLGAAPKLSTGTLNSYRTDVVARCPGAATQRNPDGSNPYKPDDAPCNLKDDAGK